VDFLGLAISIPILPYFTLELAWDEGTECPNCPQDATTTDFAVEGRCGEIDGCGTATDVSLCISVFYGGQIIGNTAMSWLSDRVGRKLVIMLSLTGSALGYLWCGLSPNLYHLYLGRTFSGIAGGTLPVVQAMILDITGDPRERPKWFGIAGAMLGFSFFVGPGVGAGIAAISSKKAGMCTPAAIAFAVILVGMFKIHETRPSGGMCGPRSAAAKAYYEKGAAEFGAMMAKFGGAPVTNASQQMPKVVYVCAVAMLLAAFSFTSMVSLVALTWPISYNLGPTVFGLWLTAVGAVTTFNNVVTVKHLAAKFGAQKVILVLSVALGIGISSFTFIDLLDPGNMQIFFLYLVVFMFLICVPYHMHMALLIIIAGEKIPPHLRGMAAGLIASGMSVGFALCPLAAGPLFGSDVLRLEHKYGSFSHLIFVLCGVVSLVEFIVLITFVGCGRRETV
jgi:MFS family permease